VWGIIKPTVCGGIYPEICERAFTLLGYTVGSYQNFPSFQRGLHPLRPGSDVAGRYGLPALAFAGDWLQTAYPSALMERAASTGREAANLILLQVRVFGVRPSAHLLFSHTCDLVLHTETTSH
jgi:uncharacterized protein with NAD-binding domain and iron-sulfur cluster